MAEGRPSRVSAHPGVFRHVPTLTNPAAVRPGRSDPSQPRAPQPHWGHEFARSRDQEAAERAGERRRCPICRPERPDRYAQLAFLVAWLTANRLDDQEEAS